MAILDWSKCPAVESVPGRLSGAWVFRDTRMPVSAVFENLEAGGRNWWQRARQAPSRGICTSAPGRANLSLPDVFGS